MIIKAIAPINCAKSKIINFCLVYDKNEWSEQEKKYVYN